MNAPAAANPSSFPLVVWIIWGGLVSAVLIYGGIGIAAVPPDPEAGDAPASALVPVLAVVAVGALALSVVVRVVLPSWMGQGKKPDFTDPAECSKYLTVRIIAFALAESVAIFGLVLRLAAGISDGLFVAFLGMALVGLAFHAPLGMSVGRRS